MASKPNVLVIAAHPDDEVLGCGGTIAKLASEGARVNIAFMTDGEGARHKKGNISPSVKRRREAAHNACKILGASVTDFGDFPDNRMDSVDLLDIIQHVERLLARHHPTQVFTHHAGDLNVDHRLTHQAVVTACRPQLSQTVRTLLFFETPSSTEWQVPGAASAFEPNWFVDISKTHKKKMAALEAYGEELRAWPHPRSLKGIDHLLRWRGATVGVEAAEAFMLGRKLE